jgi:hypothetical protein
MFTTDSFIKAEADYRAERLRNEFGHHRGTPTVPVLSRRGRRGRRDRSAA